MLKVTFSEQAHQDVLEIQESIAKDNKRAADKVTKELSDVIEFLALNPRAGRLRSFQNPRVTDIYSFILPRFPNYMLFFRFRAEILTIARVLHGARDIEVLFGN